MAFTRKSLKEIGVTDELLDKIMALHGTSLSDYQLKSEFDNAVKTEVEKQTGELSKQFEGVDIKALQEQAAQAESLQKALADTKLNYMLENRLIKEGAVNAKAVRALLDSSAITFENDKINGLDEQLTTLKESEPWAFGVTQPVASGYRQGTPSPQLTGVEMEFAKRNPGLKI